MGHSTEHEAEIFRNRLYHLTSLRRLSVQIARVSTAAQPTLEQIVSPKRVPSPSPTGEGKGPPQSPLLLPGAFNPPTNAHLALADAARQASGSTAVSSAVVSCVLSTAIINKARTERATLLDRLLLLKQIARRIDSLGVLLTNRGLYVDQAEAALAAFPGQGKVQFVVGYDKIEQIFDARYYLDRERALKRLFSLATVLVAPRTTHEAADLAALLNQPENRPFQSFVRLLPLPADFREIASSQVRLALQQQPSLDSNSIFSVLSAWLPPEASVFAQETGCYQPPRRLTDGETVDQYGLRTALISHALALPLAEQRQLNLRSLIGRANSPTPQGQNLRHWLGSPDHTPEQARLPATFWAVPADDHSLP